MILPADNCHAAIYTERGCVKIELTHPLSVFFYVYIVWRLSYAYLSYQPLHAQCSPACYADEDRDEECEDESPRAALHSVDKVHAEK